MSSKNYLNTGIFDHLSEKEKQDLLGLGRRLEFADAQCLFQKGDIGDKFYVILKGHVHITINAEGGREIILNRMGEGEVFGEIAVLDGGGRVADAYAQKGSVLISIDRNSFFRFLDSHFALYKVMTEILCKRLRWCSDLLEDFVFQDTFYRLIGKLIMLSEKSNQSGEALVEVSQDDLAKMLGSSREAVNRNLQLLQERSLIATQRKKIFIPDIGKLKEIVYG